VESILREGGVSQFVELYYWSLEPGTLDLFRSMARLPEPARSTLADFLSTACKGRPVSIVEETDGHKVELRLQSQ